jgi:hypothetical protein
MKRLIAVLFGAVLLALPIGQAADDNQVRSLVVAGGRYAFGQSSAHTTDQFMLDTQTGRLWVLVRNPTNNAPDHLKPVMFLAPDGSKVATPDIPTVHRPAVGQPKLLHPEGTK